MSRTFCATALTLAFVAGAALAAAQPVVCDLSGCKKNDSRAVKSDAKGLRIVWAADAGQPAAEMHPEFGKVYHIGSAEDLMAMVRKENTIISMPHLRTKGSTGFPTR